MNTKLQYILAILLLSLSSFSFCADAACKTSNCEVAAKHDVYNVAYDGSNISIEDKRPENTTPVDAMLIEELESINLETYSNERPERRLEIYLDENNNIVGWNINILTMEW